MAAICQLRFGKKIGYANMNAPRWYYIEMFSVHLN